MCCLLRTHPPFEAIQEPDSSCRRSAMAAAGAATNSNAGSSSAASAASRARAPHIQYTAAI